MKPIKSEATAAPHSDQLEQALLGAFLLPDGKPLMKQVTSVLSVDDWFSVRNRELYRVMLEMQEAYAVHWDTSMLSVRLQENGLLEKCGGITYLASLTDGAVAEISICENQIAVLKSLAAKRHAASFGVTVTASASNGSGVAELTDMMRDEVKTLDGFVIGADMEQAASGVAKVAEQLEAAWSEGHPMSVGLLSGFHDLDRLTGGFASGDMVVLAARPSIGKSALCSQIVTHAAKRGIPAGIISLEMSRQSLLLRMACQEAGVSMHRARTGTLDEEGRERVIAALSLLSSLPIYICDEPALPIDRVRSVAERNIRLRKLRLLVVDYLQLVRAPGENRTQEVSKVSAGLQSLARDMGRETDGALIAVSQLTRAAEDGHPELHHLRESGSIEQDADTVVLMSNAKPQDNDPQVPICKRINVAKQRNGPTLHFELLFMRNSMRFEAEAQSGYWYNNE